ncbi:MAG: flavin reductase [Clostridia bacterium]|nr:flavin reductase [Clostridia bacterium]
MKEKTGEENGREAQGVQVSYETLNPSTMLSPVPVALVSCADPEEPVRRNLLTIAWAGTINSDPPMLSISVRKSRYSHDLIQRSGEFVVNLTDERLARAADFCGVCSGRDLDKAAETGLTYIPAQGLDIAPAVEGAPVCISCKVREVKELGSHDLFLAEVAAVTVRADLLDAQGGLHLERARLVAYNHGFYQRLGETLGFFGWSVARPEALQRRMAAYQPENSYELKSARFLARDALTAAIHAGDTVVDATMGNGHDTAFLCDLVGPAGRVYAFDIQEQAVAQTRQRLQALGLMDRAKLFVLGHEHLAEQVSEPVAAVVFNLGWLPGGDHGVTTHWETTRTAIQAALTLLKPMGVVVICAYPGHPEGDRERRELTSFLSELSNRRYNVLHQSFLNATAGAPECFIIQNQR